MRLNHMWDCSHLNSPSRLEWKGFDHTPAGYGVDTWPILKAYPIPFHTPKIFGPLCPPGEMWIFKKWPPQNQPNLKKNSAGHIVEGTKKLLYVHKCMPQGSRRWRKNNWKIFKIWQLFNFSSEFLGPTLKIYCQSSYGQISFKLCIGPPKHRYF